jgi:hypothetical protein
VIVEKQIDLYVLTDLQILSSPEYEIVVFVYICMYIYIYIYIFATTYFS